MHFKRLVFLMVIAVFAIAACDSSGDGIQEITSIPDSETEVTQTSPVVASANDDGSSDETVADDTSNTTSDTDTVDETGNSESDAQAVDATPVPLDTDLEPGEARRLAWEADQEYSPEPRERIDFDEFPVNIRFEEFYEGFNLRTGLVLSDKLTSLDGQDVVMEGYIAPPLKPKIDFFVLTAIPLSSCPFCTTAADWPDDIAMVYLTEDEIIYSPYPVRISGQMEVGQSVDAETGMVSLVRIYADDVEILE